MTDLPHDEIMAYFRAEVPKLLAELESGLLHLRQDHSVAVYYRLLRAAHSVKGSAANLQMYSIRTLAQCLEDVFQTLIARPDTDVNQIEDLLLQGFDCLRLPLSQWLKTGVCDPDFALRRAKVIYEELTRILGPVPETIEPVTSADIGIDITQAIFDNDIAPKITEIQTILSRSESPLLCGELRAQFDMLTGLGEMLNLPGLARIGRVVVHALTHHPEQAKVIGELALRDLQAVMPGKHRGGEPSPELLAWAESPQHPPPASRDHDSFGGNPGESSSELEPTASAQTDDSFWEEVSGMTLSQSSQPTPENSESLWEEFGNFTPSPSTNDLTWEELGTIPPAEPLASEPTSPESENATDSFWNEISYMTTPQFQSLEPQNETPSDQEEPNDISESPDLLSFWEEVNPEQPQELTSSESENVTPSLWDEIDYSTTPQFRDSEAQSLNDSLWEEVDEITSDPLPESSSLQEEIDEMFTSEPNPSESQNLASSFWEEISEVTAPESPNLTDAFWEDIREVTAPESESLANSFWEEITELPPPESSASSSFGEELSPQWTGPPLPPSTEINPEALEFFAQEAQDLLQELESGLLTLRQNHTIPHIHALMRAAHSIKGGAATVGLPVVQVIAHRLENALQALYQWPGELDIPLEEALLQAFDTLRQPLQARLAGASFDPDIVLQKAEQAFVQLEQIVGTPEPTGSDAYVPSSQDLGVDMTATIFSGDIQQGLHHLQELLTQPTGDWLTEVTSQLEVFTNLGELLNLSGWRAICQTGLTALTQHPDQALEIAQLLLRDLQQGYDHVMAGEREYGGTVSPELQAFATGNLPANQPLPTLPEPVPDAPPTAVLTQENLNTLFEQLPPAPNFAISEPKTPASPKVSPKDQPITRGASVRVEVSRLERLNNLIGELVIQENGSFLYQQQLQKLVQTFGQRLNKFETISRMLQDTADQLTLTANKVHNETHEFDPLQMDSYNQLYTWVQTVIEEIAQVGEVMRDMGLITQQSQENLRKKQQTLKQIRGDLLWIRMVPLNEILQRFPRMIRDLCVQYNKQVNVRLIGENTLVDKAVLEKLSDPLVHLVRNAFDHGIEPPQIRIQQGKKPEGTIEIQAYYRGNQTYITVRDDGQGINLERVRQKAIEKQIFTPEQGAKASKSELLNCLFTPGFSTAATVSDLSGRGVGLDVVRLQIQELKGTIHIHTEPGQGTTFTIRLPLTLTITKLLVFSLDRRLFALAVDSLAAIISVNDENLITMQGRQLVRWQERLVPLIPPSVLEYRYPVRWVAADGTGVTLPAGQGRSLLLLSTGNEVYGLEIDQILLEQDLVIKPFSPLLAPPAYVYGCTILGDGRLVPVLDASGLVQKWLRAPDVGEVVIKTPVQTVQQTEILVVDDSLTIRGTLGKMLSKHGYRVHTAADGREALEILAQNPQIQAVFSDIEMPRMNGFEFLSACRQDPRYQSLPIIMLTSRAGEKHQKMAQNLGCSAYLTKPYLEPDLLRTLQQFVSSH